jgi:hypothetical protein
MSEAWRNSYDSWKLSGPPDEPDFETEEEEQKRLDAEARAENAAEDRAMEEHFDRKYGHA